MLDGGWPPCNYLLVTLNSIWGQRLRRLREAQGMSLRRLAEEAAVDLGHLSKGERGLKGFGDEARVRIASALGVPVNAIWAYPDPSWESDTTREAS